MKQLIPISVVVIALACAPATTPKLQLQPISVYGRVIDRTTGAPVAWANVDLDSTSWGSFTDSTGQFVLRGIPIGRYTVRLRSACEDKRVLGTRAVQLTDTAAVRVDFAVALDSLSRCQVVWLRSVR
jgi:hypothetical protein